MIIHKITLFSHALTNFDADIGSYTWQRRSAAMRSS